MNTSRPYLIRALYEWIVDNDDVPYIVVDAGFPDVQIPEDFVANGQITLNVGMSAVKSLVMDNDAISFNARFSGVPLNVYVPVMAVLAIVGKESGQGMGFGMEPSISDGDASPSSKGKEMGGNKQQPTKTTKSHLKIIK